MHGRELTELLDNAFESSITIDPRYKLFGVGINFFKGFGPFCMECSLPVAQDQFNLGIKENFNSSVFERIGQVNQFNLVAAVAGAGALPPHLAAVPAIAAAILVAVLAGTELVVPNISNFYVSAADALSSKERLYSRWSSRGVKKNGLGDLKFRLGTGGDIGNVFLQIMMPLSDRPTNKYLFEPLLGNEGKWEIGIGVDGRLTKKLKNDFYQIDVMGACDYSFAFSSKQIRTFDLAPYGSFSRYFLVREANIPLAGGAEPSLALQPGVNSLSREVNIAPPQARFNGQLGCALHMGKIFLHGGYNLNFIAQERLNSVRVFDHDYGIASWGNYLDRTAPQRFLQNSTLQGHANSQDPALLIAAPHPVINNDLLDLASATQPSKLRSGLNLQSGFTSSWLGAPVKASVGGGITLNHAYGALEDWFVSMQLGFSL